MSYIGNNEIGKVFLGNVEIDKAYLGNVLVFSTEPPKITYTFTANPSSAGGTSMTNPQNAYTSETSTTYASPRLPNTGTAGNWYFKFDTSSIPENAVILSVSCKAKARLTGTTSISPRSIGLYSGTTLKGTTETLTTSTNTFTFSGATWTRDELSDTRVRVYATKAAGSSGTSPWLYFYGATLTVTYTI